MLKALRHRIGLAKYRVLSGTLGRYRCGRANAVRQRTQGRLAALPPLSLAGGGEVEVHMLCHAAGVDMGLWASWSFLRFLPAASFYLHGDATLTKPDVMLWESKIGGMKVVLDDEAAGVAEEALRDFPRLGEFRAKHVLARKLIDFHLYGNASHLLLLDSDILCFGVPTQLLSLLSTTATGLIRWNEDIRSSYSCSTQVASAILGTTFPERMNSGLVVMRRLGVRDFAQLEGWLSQLIDTHGVRITHPWLEQTLYACLAATWDGSGPLDEPYSMSGGSLRQGQVTRHYPGNAMIRPKFWTEGVVRLCKELGGS